MAELVTFRLETTQHDIEPEKAAADLYKDLHLEKIEALCKRPGNLLAEGRFRHTALILGTATATVLARRLAEHWLRDEYQGVQLDRRGHPISISRLADVPPGHLAIINPGNKVSIHSIKDVAQGEDMVGHLARLID